MPFTKLGTNAYTPFTDGSSLTTLNASNISSGTLNTSRYVQGGIQMYDMWRLTSDLTGNADPVSSNLERVDTAGQSYVGSAMSVSSGLWTFPSTGIYLISFNAVHFSSSADDYVQTEIQACTDGSNYATASRGYEGASTGHAYGSALTQTTLDVTNTTTHKVKFIVAQSNTSNKIRGNTGYNRTTFTFLRLGDT